jgi:hypothetical protein
MILTPENKTHIDGLGVGELLHKVRFASIGDGWMQDATGEYWIKRLGELRAKDEGAYVAASKSLGWTQ